MIVVTVKLTLVSQSSQPSSTIVDAAGKPIAIAILGSSAAGTVVEGLTAENANNEGIYVQDSSGVTIENNFVNNNGLNIIKGLGEVKAIQLTGTSDSTVAGNSVVGNQYGGIGVADDGPINPSFNSTAVPSASIPPGTANSGNGNLISGNLVEHNRPNHCSIVISSYNQGEGVKNNIVSNNVVVDNEAGIIVAADTPNTAAVNNTVMNNNILNNGEGGVVVHSNAPGDVVTGNAIIGNVISANGPPTLLGIIVGGEGPVAVQNTLISSNTFQNEGVGIQIVNAKQTFVGGNIMQPTVRLPVNGTVTPIAISTPTSGGGQAAPTTTISQTGGGITFSLALIVAIGTLIVGLVAGMTVRPIREATGR
jgi:parallel beta-helix repeat protein